MLEILTHVNTTKRAAALSVEENDPYEERSKINERKRKILEGAPAAGGESGEKAKMKSKKRPEKKTKS